MFSPAVRQQVKLTIGITGPSGAGKTYGSLLMAQSIAAGQRFGVVCAENGKAAAYAKEFQFDIMVISPPYTTEKYIEAIRELERRYPVGVLDGISPAWNGDGGILNQKEQLMLTSRNTNQLSPWTTLTPKQEAFKAALLNPKIHLISTIRAKQEYAMELRNGKQVPVKVGMGPVQREGIEYEFAMFFEVDLDHNTRATKDITRLFNGFYGPITAKTGQLLLDWAMDGEAAPVVPAQVVTQATTPVQRAQPATVTPSAASAQEDRLNRLAAATDHMSLPETRVTFGRYVGKRFADLTTENLEAIRDAMDMTYPDRSKMQPGSQKFLADLEAYIKVRTDADGAGDLTNQQIG
ncbi:hypothetical protein [Bdellovibrio bacteriovorus]|uniref:hypothetical protein n=1 Tax=Bdellovibrio bacteriovorus TaxID=959 RepID=UPI003AA7FE56